ncbi:O-methyltransferase [Eisenibacter elegans]|jgi:predicted O-methyltransferase YrrM|uniref:O-methyltransferase n=1 Tax=Eisenibacter elegans TaxID=997 RepID=UPI0004067110|nr:O-methyltransferase [Eisenibacter elegans]
MEFIDPALHQYAEAHTSAEPEQLQALNRDTHAHVLKPRMLSGHLQGRFLALLSQLKQPRYILEIGTYTGYSALCLAEGLQPQGELHTLDNNEELAPRIRRYFAQSPYAAQLHLHIGNALDLIPALKQPFDLVFIDADKKNYDKYYDLIFDQLPSGALIIADNVLWSGKVIQPVKGKDVDTQALLDFNAKVQADPRVENVLLPVRDGLMLVRKK